jgi:non-heme Fe2+,alpha-ketoglutarate-dependent halogenase
MENGPMEFLRGSHTTPFPTHDTYAADNLLTRGQVIDWEQGSGIGPPRKSDIVYDVLQPGQYSIHHLGIAHGGSPNEGDDRRIGFNVTYVTPETRSVRPEGAFAQLIRGVDDYGHFTLDLHPR